MESEHKENEKTAPPKVDLLKVDIKDENTALNVLVGFLGLAQSRGVFAINESAKIFEAVKMFNGTPK
tara:strand:- start:500 stop:700 length:201 start_codon:yes stop_codon:yes gene_type:complete